MEWIALGLSLATILITIGVYKMKIEQLAKDMDLWRATFEKHEDRDDSRFDQHTRRLNDQEVAHQAIHTSLQFIISKLDKIEEKVG